MILPYPETTRVIFRRHLVELRLVQFLGRMTHHIRVVLPATDHDRLIEVKGHHIIVIVAAAEIAVPLTRAAMRRGLRKYLIPETHRSRRCVFRALYTFN